MGLLLTEENPNSYRKCGNCLGFFIATSQIAVCIFVNDVRPKRRKNNQVQRIVKRPAGVEREGRSEAEERPNEARRAARRGEIIAR